MLNKQETVSELRSIADRLQSFSFHRDSAISMLEDLIEKIKENN